MHNDVKHLITDSHRSTALQAVELIRKDPALIDSFLALALSGLPQYAMRASHVLEKADNADPTLLKPYLKRIIQKLPDIQDSGVKRGFLKLFTDKDLTKFKREQVILLDLCFNALNNHSDAIAVRVYAIPILYHLSTLYPDLKIELKASLEHVLANQAPPALRSVGKKYLKKL